MALDGGLTPKQEAFVSAYLETGNATESYRRAGYSTNATEASLNVSACRLLKHPSVSAKIESLRAKVIAKADAKIVSAVAGVIAATDTKIALSRAWIIGELMDNVTKAKSAEDFVAANKALELLGKTDEMRLFLERSESDNRHHHSAEPLSPFAEHLAEIVGADAEGETKGSLPH